MTRQRVFVFQTVAAAVALLICACSPTPEATRDIAAQEGHTAMTIQVTSTAFQPNTVIPKKHTGDGADVSPPLAWKGIPKGTKELALIMDDPDAPRPEPWVHWVIYKIPPEVTMLPEHVAADETPPAPEGAMQGKNSWDTIGYRGPAPPPGHGVHHYHFRLFALDRGIDASPGLTKEKLLAKLEGHVLASGELIGTFER